MSGDSDRNANWVRSALHRYEAPLTRYAYAITGDLEGARDVVQDTFLRLCSQSSAQLNEHLAPWLFKVCRNRALDVRKKEARRKTFAQSHTESQQSPEPLQSAELERNETLRHVLEQLSALPENQGEVLRLKFQNDLSYREISEVTGLSVSNVGFLIHRGLRSLRQKLGRNPGGHAEPMKRVR